VAYNIPQWTELCKVLSMKVDTVSHVPRTVQDVREWFDEEGLRVADWAKAHGFKADQVYAFLSGRTRGRSGAAHRVALALGLKQQRWRAPAPVNERAQVAQAADTSRIEMVEVEAIESG
jgi:gp16 family phage-associated protein